MKKKLIALTVAAVLTVSAISLAGCNITTQTTEAPPTPPPVVTIGREVTETEWCCAFAFCLGVPDYTAEIQYTEGLPVKVTIADYEAGNYTLPDFNNGIHMAQTSKITADLSNGFAYDPVHLKLFDSGKTFEQAGYIALYNYKDVLYDVEYVSGKGYDITKTDSTKYWNMYEMFMGDVLLKTLWYSYSDFTYNSEDGTYSGKITASEDNTDKTADVEVKINLDNLDSNDLIKGALVSGIFECAYNGFAAYKYEDSVMVSRVTFSFKIYDYNKTLLSGNKETPIPNELVAEIENAIKT